MCIFNFFSWKSEACISSGWITAKLFSLLKQGFNSKSTYLHLEVIFCKHVFKHSHATFVSLSIKHLAKILCENGHAWSRGAYWPRLLVPATGGIVLSGSHPAEGLEPPRHLLGKKHSELQVIQEAPGMQNFLSQVIESPTRGGAVC